VINRLKQLMEEEPLRPPAQDHFVVSCDFGSWFVSRVEAERLQRLLRRRWPPGWLCFRDLFGAEVAVATREILSISESTGLLRQRCRDLQRSLEEEERSDRPCDDGF
jgi:hypothetical protein